MSSRCIGRPRIGGACRIAQTQHRRALRGTNCSPFTPEMNTPGHLQCRATAPTHRPRRLIGLPPATLPIRSAPPPPGTLRETVSNFRRLRIRHQDPLHRRHQDPLHRGLPTHTPPHVPPFPKRPRPRAMRSQGVPARLLLATLAAMRVPARLLLATLAAMRVPANPRILQAASAAAAEEEEEEDEEPSARGCIPRGMIEIGADPQACQ